MVKRKILGIDPGSNLIGYGLIESCNSNLKCMEYGCIDIKEKNPQLRLLFLEKSLNKLLKKLKPDLIVLEKLFFCKNIKTAIKVSESRGVILLAIAKNNIPLIETTPLELKKSLTNYGRSSKVNIQKMVKLVLDLKEEPKPDDAADALALAIVGTSQNKSL